MKWIRADNPQAATRIAERIWDAVAGIPHEPFVGRACPEFAQERLRERILPPFRLIYAIDENAGEIRLLRIWHAARGTPRLR